MTTAAQQTDETKVCLLPGCGGVLVRNRRKSRADWDARGYCDRGCMARHREQKKRNGRGTSRVVVAPPPPPAPEWRQVGEVWRPPGFPDVPRGTR